MTAYKGNQKIATVYHGGTLIKQVNKGETVVYRRAVIRTFARTFTTNSSISIPATTTNIQCWLVGGGGGGGGGAGGFSYKNYGASLAGTSQGITVGVGGAGQSGLVNKVGTCSAGGGGGSSYTHPELCSEVVHTQGFQSGNGYATISMV